MGDALPVVDLGAGRRATALAMGSTATCALFDDGAVKCWGDPYQGATGHGDIQIRGDRPGTMGDNLPIVDVGSRDGVAFKVKAIAAFDYHSFCAILEDTGDDDSGLKCWGSNDYCELGLGHDDQPRRRTGDDRRRPRVRSTSERRPRAEGARRSRWAADINRPACSATTAPSTAGGPTGRASLGSETIGDPRSCAVGRGRRRERRRPARAGDRHRGARPGRGLRRSRLRIAR